MNTYTPTWFELFLATIEPAQTERETDFLARQLPLPAFRRVLDVCCGTGRHAHALARRGYEVLGVDRDPDAVEKARAQAPEGSRFLVGDMRDLGAALALWQGLGYFDDMKSAFLRALHGKLRPGERLLLDVYHRYFFEAHQWEGHFPRGGRAQADGGRAAAGEAGLRGRTGEGRLRLAALHAGGAGPLRRVHLPSGLHGIRRAAACLGGVPSPPSQGAAGPFRLFPRALYSPA